MLDGRGGEKGWVQRTCQDLGDHWNAESEEEERILEILSLGNCAKSGQGGKGVSEELHFFL